MAAARMQREWNIEDRDEARVYSRAVLSNLVTDAKAAGFNPLTVLRNGGGAGYNAAASFPPLSRTAPVREATMGPDIGGALQNVGDFLVNFDPLADEKKELEGRLVEAQIRNLDASTGAFRSQSFKVPSATAGEFKRKPMGTGAGPNGEVLPMYVQWRDRNGNLVETPNPDLPESEQFLVPPLATGENAVAKPAAGKSPNEWGLEVNRAIRDWWNKPAAPLSKPKPVWGRQPVQAGKAGRYQRRN